MIVFSRGKRRAALVSLIIATMLGTTACGTILYPERKGQVDGRIDAGVAVLDGIGLLFFLVPGVIAYAVDFADGTIYLPSTADNGRFDLHNATVIHTDNPDLDRAAIEKAIREKTGKSISINNPALRVRHRDANHWRRLKVALAPAQYAALMHAPKRLAVRTATDEQSAAGGLR